MNRADLIQIMVQAIKDSPNEDATEVAEKAAQATGLRRALYSNYGLGARAAMIRRAKKVAKEEAR